MNVLYILMRTDMDSMNPGKAMAQASHASNAFVYRWGKEKAVKEWQGETQQGFGTVLVLGVTGDELYSVVEKVNESPDPDAYLNCTVYAPELEFLKK